MERRRSKGFVPLGGLSPHDLGIPRRHASALLLAVAWQKVAGEAVAHRVRAIRIRRRVLELEAFDVHWDRAVRPLLPRLGRRLAIEYPGLQVAKLRLLRPALPGGFAAETFDVDLAAPNGQPEEGSGPPR